MKQISRILSVAVFLMAISVLVKPAYGEIYKIDKNHTLVGFSVQHLMITNVHGKFKDFSGIVDINDATWELERVEAVIDVNSIDTGNEKRDGHLKAPDFFDAAKYPKITYKSTAVEKNGDFYDVKGNLTMHGITKQVMLKVKMTGLVDAGKFGGKKAGFTGSGSLNRQDFGVSWNRELGDGGVVVGDMVRLNLEVEVNASQ